MYWEKQILILRFLNKHIRKNHLLTRCIFRIAIEPAKRIHWDFTTLVLKKYLSQFILPSHKVLEMGTGPYALLSIWLSRRRRCVIHACDINAEYVESAARYVERNKVSIKVIRSDLYANVPESYDVVFFNSVYIPTERGNREGIAALHEYSTDWCGGEDGLQTITRFLTGSMSHLLPGGRVLLGFNSIYLQEDEVFSLCNKLGYSIAGIYSHPPYPSKVYILKI